MNSPNARRWDELRRRWDRSLRAALLVSVILHVLLVLLFRQSLVIPNVPQSAAGPDNQDDRAAAGGGVEIVALRMIQPPPAPEEAIIPIPVPVPTEIPQPQPERPPSPPASPTPIGEAPSAGEGRGQAQGPGTETGTGAGSGGTGEEGTSRVTAPTPRGLILPPSDRPARVRGNTVTVYVFVSDRGTVMSDSTRIAPSSGDRGFDNLLRRQAADWVFNPARRDGRPVAEWFQYVIVL
jgi:outer membrane biosynthesis protein TonB